jgi:hypothetical protein
MDKDLIEVYAHGNMLEALLAYLVEDIIRREKNPENSLQQLRNGFASRMLASQIPDSLPYEDTTLLRSRGAAAADEFFRRVAARLGYKVATEFWE